MHFQDCLGTAESLLSEADRYRKPKNWVKGKENKLKQICSHWAVHTEMSVGIPLLGLQCNFNIGNEIIH